MNKRKRMRQRAIRLYRRKQPIYFLLRSIADVLQNVNNYIRNIGKSLERL